MKTGMLNRRIEIQRRGEAVDEWGQPAPESWVKVRDLWASIKHQNGSQSIKADTPTSRVRASIRIRYRTDIDAGMRVVYKGTVYEIEAVLPDEEKRERVDLVCVVVS